MEDVQKRVCEQLTHIGEAPVGGREEWRSFVIQMTHLCENINSENGEDNHLLTEQHYFWLPCIPHLLSMDF